MPGQVDMDSNLGQIRKVKHLRYGQLGGRSRRRTLRTIVLASALAVVTLILAVVSIYSTARISTLNEGKRQLEYELGSVQDQLEALKPELEKFRTNLDQLVNDRIPGLYGLETNKVLDVQNEYIKNIVFTVIRRGAKDYYKYLLVVENNGGDKITPTFKVLLFDSYGVHVATHQVDDSNVLGPGESRDYTSEIDFFFEVEPGYFYIDSLIPKTGG